MEVGLCKLNTRLAPAFRLLLYDVQGCTSSSLCQKLRVALVEDQFEQESIVMI